MEQQQDGCIWIYGDLAITVGQVFQLQAVFGRTLWYTDGYRRMIATITTTKRVITGTVHEYEQEVDSDSHIYFILDKLDRDIDIYFIWINFADSYIGYGMSRDISRVSLWILLD